MTQPATPTPRFDTFYRYDALTRLLFDYADAHPGLVAVASIGKSFEGRDIWVATVTNTATGAPEDKPAFWADGNPDKMSESHLYFTNQTGSHVWRLPYVMEEEYAAPLPLEKIR